MSELVLICPTQGFGKWEENHESWGAVPKIVVRGIRPLTKAYQVGYEQARELHPAADILAFVHDDCAVYDPTWKERVLAEFDDPQVGLVGFGGSTGHGVPDIYKTPYAWQQVGRTGTFMSNMVNAELHGERINHSRNAAFLDGFALFVRSKILEKWGGWPQNTPVAYWCYDMAISCETRRQGYRIRVVGVDCEHTCPETFDTSAVRSYVIEEDCQAAHKWLYENYADTFPARV